MIELIVIWRLAVGIGREAAQKGLKKIPYQIMAILLWICGELMGFVWAFALLGNNETSVLTYGLALIGALIGAGVAFLIMKLIPEQPTLSDSAVAIGTQDSSVIQMFGRRAWLPVLVIVVAVACSCIAFFGGMLF
jgi:hypothetical protein